MDIHTYIHTYLHRYWKKTHEDRNHLDDNPQYILRVTASRDTMVWLLLGVYFNN